MGRWLPQENTGGDAIALEAIVVIKSRIIYLKSL
jgi:hypothetical protein